MQKSMSLTILGLLLSFLSVGCDKLCHKTVEDVATIQNMTGRPLSLSICKGRSYGEVIVPVAQNMTLNEVSIGTHEGSEVRGGMSSNSCSGVTGGKETMGISLAPNSFGQVKLCYNDIDYKNVIVEIYQACPTGFLMQTSTGPCT